MDLAYSFWCSRCKVSHAGECRHRPMCPSCPAGFCQGHPAPTEGSRWQSRSMSVQSGQTWNSRWRYVVQEVTDEGVRVSGYNGYGHFCGDRILEPSIWTSEGAVVEDGPGRSHRLWMLPEGNVR